MYSESIFLMHDFEMFTWAGSVSYIFLYCPTLKCLIPKDWFKTCNEAWRVSAQFETSIDLRIRLKSNGCDYTTEKTLQYTEYWH